MPRTTGTAEGNGLPSSGWIGASHQPLLLWLLVGVLAISGILSAFNETVLLLPGVRRSGTGAAARTTDEQGTSSSSYDNADVSMNGDENDDDIAIVLAAPKELQNLREALGCDELSSLDCSERARQLVQLSKAQGQGNEGEGEVSDGQWKRLFQCRDVHGDCAEKATFLAEHLDREQADLQSVRAEALKALQDTATTSSHYYHGNDDSTTRMATDNNKNWQQQHWGALARMEHEVLRRVRSTSTTKAGKKAFQDHSTLYYNRDDDHSSTTRTMDNSNIEKNWWLRHPALTPLRPEYAPRQSWSDSFPDLNLAGLAKAGTSKLFDILVGHDSVRPAHDHGKEYCISPRTRRSTWPIPSKAPLNQTDKINTQKKLFEYHKSLAKQKKRYATRSDDRSNNNGPPLTANGCLNYRDLYMHLSYVRPGAGKKFIVLFRDPADWLWSSWNFWSDTDLDQAQIPSLGDHTKVGVHYRSPELFHELILSGGKLRSGHSLLSYRFETVELPRRLIQFAGRENTLFLRNEDIRRRPEDSSSLPALHRDDADHPLEEDNNNDEDFLDRLCAFAGLDRSGFGTRVLATLDERVNCNDAKKGTCGNRTTTAYKVARGRGMLDSTRRLIYLHFAKECQIWAREFGVVYQACLDAVQE